MLRGGNLIDNRDGDTHYGYPWPLSEDFYLVTEANGDRIFLLDKYGNREVIYSGFTIPEVSGLRVVSPRPFRARKRPPIVPTATNQGERQSLDAAKATISVVKFCDLALYTL